MPVFFRRLIGIAKTCKLLDEIFLAALMYCASTYEQPVTPGIFVIAGKGSPGSIKAVIALGWQKLAVKCPLDPAGAVAVETRRRTPGWAAARRARRESLRRGSWLKDPPGRAAPTCPGPAHAESSAGLVAGLAQVVAVAAQDHQIARARFQVAQGVTLAADLHARAPPSAPSWPRGSGPLPEQNPVVKKAPNTERLWRCGASKQRFRRPHGMALVVGRGPGRAIAVVNHHACSRARILAA